MGRKTFQIKVPFDVKEVLLHTCCAPCSSAIIEWMMQNEVRPTLYFCNPNIYPEQEYVVRKEECIRYADSFGLQVIDADYNHPHWLERMRGLEQEPERGVRCSKCFAYRLASAALYAHENGYKVMTTTLASSRWKSLGQVIEAGKLAVADYPDVIFWAQNWRKGGLSDRRNAIVKEMNFYNQQYCGCEFSLRQAITHRRAKTEAKSDAVYPPSIRPITYPMTFLNLSDDVPDTSVSVFYPVVDVSNLNG